MPKRYPDILMTEIADSLIKSSTFLHSVLFRLSIHFNEAFIFMDAIASKSSIFVLTSEDFRLPSLFLILFH